MYRLRWCNYGAGAGQRWFERGQRGPTVDVPNGTLLVLLEDAEAAVAAERLRMRLALEAERDGPGIDWSDIDQVDALIERVSSDHETASDSTTSSK